MLSGCCRRGCAGCLFGRLVGRAGFLGAVGSGFLASPGGLVAACWLVGVPPCGPCLRVLARCPVCLAFSALPLVVVVAVGSPPAPWAL